MDVRAGDVLVVKDARGWNDPRYEGSLLLVELVDDKGWHVRFISRATTPFVGDKFMMDSDYFERAAKELEIVGHIDV